MLEGEDGDVGTRTVGIVDDVDASGSGAELGGSGGDAAGSSVGVDGSGGGELGSDGGGAGSCVTVVGSLGGGGEDGTGPSAVEPAVITPTRVWGHPTVPRYPTGAARDHRRPAAADDRRAA